MGPKLECTGHIKSLTDLNLLDFPMDFHVFMNSGPFPSSLTKFFKFFDSHIVSTKFDESLFLNVGLLGHVEYHSIKTEF